MIGPAGPRIHEHVGRLDITVHQPGCVGGIQGRSHRGDDRGRARNRQRAQPVHERPHIAARHIPHRDEQHAIRIASFEYRDNVRVIDGRRGSRFMNETVPE